MSDATRSISRAVEELALALGQAGAVPRGELVRALERAAERLRGPLNTHAVPTDLVSQASAARLVGVSRQAVNQWVRKGMLRTYPSEGGGRQASQVSLAETSIAANRWTVEPFSPGLRRQLGDFLEAASRIPGIAPIAEGVGFALTTSNDKGLSEEGSRVLREFLIGAMGTAGSEEEFTDSGVRMLSDLVPAVRVDATSEAGRLLDSLDLLVRSRDGAAGFDSASAAVLGLLGAATVGSRVAGDDAAVGIALGEAAAALWGDAWVDRLFDIAFHLDELQAPALTRYTAPLVYLGCNRFMRQAQVDGVSITYAASPGAILPQSYYGGPVFARLLAGQSSQRGPWDFMAWPQPATPVYSDRNPFRVFNFAFGLFDPSIHGIRRYCYHHDRAARELKTYLGAIGDELREPYLNLATRTLASTLELPFVEMAAVVDPAGFDWWKSHIIRSSPRETLIGLRGERARSVAHGLLVRSSALPQVLESGEEGAELRERLRLYAKNVDFELIDERYRDDRARGVTTVVKAGTETLGTDEALARAREVVAALLAADS
jgi:hypothetical protein